MNRVLVTGAGGFIGRGTLGPLRRRGYEVHAVRSPRPGAGSAPPVGDELDPRCADVQWHEADLLEPRAAETLLGELSPTHLLHLAWYAEPGAFWESPENLRWVEASLRLLRAFAGHGGRRAVIAGTCAEYEWEDHTLCRELLTPCRPATLYGAAKHGLHVIAERYAAHCGLSLGWGRVFFVFGPFEHPARLGGAVARALVRGEPVPCSHGEQRRDFLYSEDVAGAFTALVDSAVEGPVNLGSGEPARIRDVVEALADAAGRPELPQFGARPAARGEPAELLADVTRLRQEVGWTAPAPLHRRAADTIAWWRRHLMVADPRRAPA